MRSEDGKNCTLAAPLTPPVGECQNPDDTYLGSSGWRLIPGNACRREGGENLDARIERPCDSAPGNNGSLPQASKSVFKARMVGEYYYLERQQSSHGHDETIIMLTRSNELYVSHDHGKVWRQALPEEKITVIIPHPFYSDGAFFLTPSKKGFYTLDRGYTIKPFQAPLARNEEHLPVLTFHPKYKDWLIWTGAADCGTPDCHSDAYISKNRGKDWQLFLRYVQKCEFASREDREDSDLLLFCEQFEKESRNNPLQLLSSENFFDDSKLHFDDLIDFATMSEFIVVASRDARNPRSLRASTSVDGRIFADAEFPANLDVPDQKAYTVLESSTHAIFLHVTVNNVEGLTYGSILKSNSNGTSYVLSLNGVNRNDDGYVDFEKMQGLEGVAIVNVVGNLDSLDSGGVTAGKKLKTMITHNDGAQWTLLAPPLKDSEGIEYDCSKENNVKCSLHLHGYTERKDPRDTFSSGSAVGLMFGVGNVGEFLTSKDDADTFLSRDGGITWKSVKKGRYMWEYGDAGSVIVIVPESSPTRVLYYSTDEGETWEEYKFSDVEMRIDDISMVPSDTSKSFLLWGRELDTENKDKFATVNVDFSAIRSRDCILNEDLSTDTGDYELWVPSHPLQEGNCLFGHVEQYHRKKEAAQCWNNWGGSHIHSIVHNCSCTRADYEW